MMFRNKNVKKEGTFEKTERQIETGIEIDTGIKDLHGNGPDAV